MSPLHGTERQTLPLFLVAVFLCGNLIASQIEETDDLVATTLLSFLERPKP